MAFDFKKEYKEFYMPKQKPSIVEVPAMNYIAVRGSGDPNAEDGEYKKSIELLYGIAYEHKENFQWISVIRLPDFVTKEEFDWAVQEAGRKKKQDFSGAEFWTYEEGLCVQCLHVGPFDDEPATVESMHQFMEQNGYALDITDARMHHEIYLSDARKVAPEKWKTVIRHPVRKI